MSKTIKAADLAGKSPEEILEILKGGVKLVEATAPYVKELFGKIGELFAGIAGNNGPKQRLKRIEFLEAQNQLQKAENKLLWEAIEALKPKG